MKACGRRKCREGEESRGDEAAAEAKTGQVCGPGWSLLAVGAGPQKRHGYLTGYFHGDLILTLASAFLFMSWHWDDVFLSAPRKFFL